jgi:hypothetical protein
MKPLGSLRFTYSAKTPSRLFRGLFRSYCPESRKWVPIRKGYDLCLPDLVGKDDVLQMASDSDGLGYQERAHGHTKRGMPLRFLTVTYGGGEGKGSLTSNMGVSCLTSSMLKI